jgi:prepilin-type processing-associated H-X9-DG protein
MRNQGPHQASHEDMLARFTIKRHACGTDIVFFDGHAETVRLERLEQLKWHEGWKAQD